MGGDCTERLLLNDFAQQSQGFFAIVAAKVVDLPHYLGVEGGKQLVEEHSCVVLVGLAELS